MIFKRCEFTQSVEWRLVCDGTRYPTAGCGNLIINKRFCRLREAYCVHFLPAFVCSHRHTLEHVCMILNCNAFRRLCRRLVSITRKRNYAKFSSFDLRIFRRRTAHGSRWRSRELSPLPSEFHSSVASSTKSLRRQIANGPNFLMNIRRSPARANSSNKLSLLWRNIAARKLFFMISNMG